MWDEIVELSPRIIRVRVLWDVDAIAYYDKHIANTILQKLPQSIRFRASGANEKKANQLSQLCSNTKQRFETSSEPILLHYISIIYSPI